jgi:hypothetical protein
MRTIEAIQAWAAGLDWALSSPFDRNYKRMPLALPGLLRL